MSGAHVWTWKGVKSIEVKMGQLANERNLGFSSFFLSNQTHAGVFCFPKSGEGHCMQPARTVHTAAAQVISIEWSDCLNKCVSPDLESWCVSI